MKLSIFFLLLTVAMPCFAQAQDVLPLSSRDQKFIEFVNNLDLDAESTVLDYKSGTTSVGVKIRISGDYKAYWLPNENGAGKAEGQVVTYTLGQFLGISKIVIPSDYLFVKGRALKKFRDMLSKHKDRGRWKLENKKKIKRAVRKNIQNSKAHYGALSLKKKKFSVDSLVSGNKLKASHPLAKMIQAFGPKPSSEKVYSGLNREMRREYRGGEANLATELQLARDLSRIMVLDALVGQWDRFSGGNLEARLFRSKSNRLEGRIRFFARDNGGSNATSATPVSGHFKKYLKTVSRFDRKQIEMLKVLQAWLARDPGAVREHLKYRKSVKSLTLRVNGLLKHIKSKISRYGEDKVFF